MNRHHCASSCLPHRAAIQVISRLTTSLGSPGWRPGLRDLGSVTSKPCDLVPDNSVPFGKWVHANTLPPLALGERALRPQWKVRGLCLWAGLQSLGRPIYRGSLATPALEPWNLGPEIPMCTSWSLVTSKVILCLFAFSIQYLEALMSLANDMPLRSPCHPSAGLIQRTYL